MAFPLGSCTKMKKYLYGSNCLVGYDWFLWHQCRKNVAIHLGNLFSENLSVFFGGGWFLAPIRRGDYIVAMKFAQNLETKKNSRGKESVLNSPETPQFFKFGRVSYTSWWFQPMWKILISQIGSFSQGSGWKLKNVWNHHPVSSTKPLQVELLPIWSTRNRPANL